MELILENVVKKVKPILDTAMLKHLGITVSEIETDITDKITKNPLLLFSINSSISFKKSKQEFKKHYFENLLKRTSGNVSESAKISGIKRETIHRLISKLKIKINNIRETKPQTQIKEEAIKEIIKASIESYKTSLNPVRYETFYQQAPTLSKDILKQIPDIDLTLDQAEKEFEKQYLKKALKENNNNISQTARRIGLRFETLHRKMKSLGI